MSEAGSREDSNFMDPLWKAAVFLANVVEVFANCFVSMMFPSSARAASLTVIFAMSALSCSTVWALAVASVTWACCWIQTACCCCVAICKTRSSCAICSTTCCLTDDQNSAWHSHTSFLRLDGGRTSKHDELPQTQNHVHDQKSSSC